MLEDSYLPENYVQVYANAKDVHIKYWFDLFKVTSGNLFNLHNMKSSDAKASKCHFKFSSLMMIFYQTCKFKFSNFT